MFLKRFLSLDLWFALDYIWCIVYCNSLRLQINTRCVSVWWGCRRWNDNKDADWNLFLLTVSVFPDLSSKRRRSICQTHHICSNGVDIITAEYRCSWWPEVIIYTVLLLMQRIAWIFVLRFVLFSFQKLSWIELSFNVSGPNVDPCGTSWGTKRLKISTSFLLLFSFIIFSSVVTFLCTAASVYLL